MQHHSTFSSITCFSAKDIALDESSVEQCAKNWAHVKSSYVFAKYSFVK